MIFYIIPFLIWATLCIWKALHAHKELKLLDYVFALPLILLAVLRGEVGTDTVNYIANAQYIIWWKEQGQTTFEFGYIFLVRLLAILTSDPRVVVALISLLAAIAFFAMLYMWENGQCIVSLVFIPVCFYTFTMNGLRIGIAFPLAAIAVLQLKNKHFIVRGDKYSNDGSYIVAHAFVGKGTIESNLEGGAIWIVHRSSNSVSSILPFGRSDSHQVVVIFCRRRHALKQQWLGTINYLSCLQCHSIVVF
jgi:hypothetical protein